MPYSRFTSQFVGKAFGEDLLFELLDDDEVAELDVVLRFFHADNEHYVNARIKKWKNGDLETKEIVRFLEWNRTRIEEYQRFLKKIANKIPQK